MSFHIAGIASSAFFLLSLLGLWIQLKTIWQRKRNGLTSTAVLSLNRFVMAFYAFFAFFTYGLFLDEINPYLVWPRVIALALVLMILWELVIDRQSNISNAAFILCVSSLLAVLVFVLVFDRATAMTHSFSQILMVLFAVLLGQSYIHQVFLIRRNKDTGALAKSSHQLYLCKDVSSFVFGMVMGFSDGWPVMVMSLLSALSQLTILWHFRWCRSLPVETI